MPHGGAFDEVSQIRVGRIGKRREPRPPKKIEDWPEARLKVDRQVECPTIGGSADDGGEIDRLPPLLNAAAFFAGNTQCQRRRVAQSTSCSCLDLPLVRLFQASYLQSLASQMIPSSRRLFLTQRFDGRDPRRAQRRKQ
jgi:hypothetical protein